MDESFNMQQFPSTPSHSREQSDFDTASQRGGFSPYLDQNTPNPFATPSSSVYNGITSAYASSGTGDGKYFRSRRILKDKNAKPPVFKKHPKEKWLTIMPVCGIAVGLALSGVLMYFKMGLGSSSNFCSILSDDFSNGINPAIWTMEQEVGGFG